ncbi:hypothetical protein NV379_13320 [Paenibacillus sp. N1-5-1-14]|uniref:hypothetical protein n=1 Tax=Paenibacillus radicibacter TaxID=2972488 RepID=UPI002158DC5C|nr:hypothetical protein [Paenibacillus radicibacter]MCR8643631.1 hypothetical protein [Paenibacillus radicibacter]
MKIYNRIMLAILLISLSVMLAGYVQLNNSVTWGTENASKFVKGQPAGSVDIGQYNVMLDGHISQLRWKGGIMLFISGSALLLSFFGLIFKNTAKFVYPRKS